MNWQYFNPLRHVFKFKSAPHAVTLGASWKQKMGNSFDAIAGRNIYSDTGHVGIFDWLTLGIPLGIAMIHSKLDSAAKDYPASSLKFYKFLVGLIHLPLTLLRIASSIVLTAISFFITGIVHLIASQIAKKYMNLASEAVVITINPNTKAVETGVKLSKYMEIHGSFTPVLSKVESTDNFKLSIEDWGGYVSSNAAQLEAMYKLNLFNITSKLEVNDFTLTFKKTEDGKINQVEAFNEANKNTYNVIFPDRIEVAESLSASTTAPHFIFTPR